MNETTGKLFVAAVTLFPVIFGTLTRFSALCPLLLSGAFRYSLKQIKRPERLIFRLAFIAVLPITLGIPGTVFAWWHDSVDYYYNHKVEAMHTLHDCEVSVMMAAPANSRQQKVLFAIVQMNENQNPGWTSADYGITVMEYWNGFSTVMHSSNDCWNAATALGKP
ncbi:hypothetical protein [Paraburkholderia sediminicola]|uniref:hypothetical protein n=1 Tax=Paraburkholderia sediminicola TaxID=458836 RepID=UPI0038B7BA03